MNNFTCPPHCSQMNYNYMLIHFIQFILKETKKTPELVSKHCNENSQLINKQTP